MRKFKTEAELCAAFQSWASENGYRVYPECCGYDIVLVDSDGIQTAVEAKLALTLHLLNQALPPQWQWNTVFGREPSGTTHRAVLLPEAVNGEMENLLCYLCLGVFYPRRFGLGFAEAGARNFDWNPARPLELPAVADNITAGQPSPLLLSKWKIAALRVMAVLELDGTITRKKIAELGISPTRWCQWWLEPVSKGIYKMSAKKMPRFDLQHPETYAGILAEEKAKRVG